MKTHRFAYLNVIRHKPLWDKTTDKYKRFVIKRYYELSESECNINHCVTKFLKLISDIIFTLK